MNSLYSRNRQGERDSDHAEPSDPTPEEIGITCIHAQSGLCAGCREEWEEDWQSYVEYGQHTYGIANTEALVAEMARENVAPWTDEENAKWQALMQDVPF